LIGAGLVASYPSSAQTPAAGTLRGPDAFASISDSAARSRALFTEAAKVIMGPRCMNCHPAGEHPTQGNDMHEHRPPAFRGDGGVGVAGMMCGTCHTERNYTLHEGASYQSIPGHPRWGLAPVEMAWQGKSVGDICRQIKDPARNGGRDLKLLHDHMATDDVVAWAWQPGDGRAPAPGTQAMLGELIQAWIDTGAQCP
jgi:hypothetical protein